MSLRCWILIAAAGCTPAAHAGAPGHHPPTGKCGEIVQACHDVGRAKGGEPETCHQLGHRGDEAACAAEHARCTSLCRAESG